MAEPHPPGNNTITSNLPSEILFFQILPKLPAISLPNAMCVCKKWYLFLKSGAFATAYHHHMLTNNDHQNHHKYLVLPTNTMSMRTTTTERMIRSIDCERPQDGLTADCKYRPLFLPFSGTMSILTSLHGLVCVGKTNDVNYQEYHELILWNPLTGEDKTLSKPKKSCDPHKECYKVSYEGIFALYYISSDDDYRLLRVTGHDHVSIYIYSLKSNSWRKVESTQDIPQMASNWRTLLGNHRILLGEKLYFFKQVDRGGEGTFIQSYSVIRFDTKTEKFTEIAIPSFGNQMTSCLGFMVIKGCIHFCVAILIEEENYMANRRCYEMIELWRMDGDHGDWTKVSTYGPMSFFVWGESVLHLMSNGNLLIQNHGDVYVVDTKKDTKAMMFTYDIKNCEIALTGKYIETIVSPHQYKLFV